MDKQNEVEITAVNCEGTNLRNSNRFHFIPVMSYSRTYRRSNGVDMNQTNMNARQRAGGPETGEGSNEDEVNRRHTEIPKQERRDGFTIIRPDEGKRSHLLEVAKRETEAAQARSEARRSKPIHERPRRVGGAANYSATISQKQKAVTAASRGLEIQKKREKWQKEKRQREERELQEKKAKARAQAERNEVLQAVRAQEMMEKHREAHRWKNQEFLDKLEKRNSYSGY